MNISPVLLKKLDVIQNMALRIISGAMCTTPINNMEAETCIQPLCIRRLFATEKFCLKVLAINNDIVSSRICLPEVLQSSLQTTPYVSAADILNSQYPLITRVMGFVTDLSGNMHKSQLWPVYECKYEALICKLNVDTSFILDEIDFKEYCSNKTNSLYLYTDGSKSLNSVKSGYYDPQNKTTKCFNLDQNCSIYTAEAYAIYQTLMYVQNLNNIEQYNEIIIVSDSKSVLLSLQNFSFNYKVNYIVYKIRNIVYNLNINVTFKWVPSHRGIKGNEVVDKAVNSNHDEDHSNICKIPFTDLYTNLKNDKRRLWNEYYKDVSKMKGRWYAEIQKELPIKPWYHNHKDANERKYITTINRLRFGHCQTPAHLHRMKITDNNKCTYCEADGADLTHIIMRCPKFNMQRLALVADIREALNTEEEENETTNTSASDALEETVESVDSNLMSMPDLPAQIMTADTCHPRNAVPRRVQDILANQKLYKCLFNFISTTVEQI
ncbi:uncharacterized protein LOC125490870 [Plutella xylostella]|uniref:uncharacterized protein LOC125490870 n=1 Tax=Plutella xylostella TaxID=51655 RepID=UPI002032ACD5|nr:uncharacterized protein LOC125490870 [Plutella xylostella]